MSARGGAASCTIQSMCREITKERIAGLGHPRSAKKPLAPSAFLLSAVLMCGNVPLRSQNLEMTLSGVTFADDSSASGAFILNPPYYSGYDYCCVQSMNITLNPSLALSQFTNGSVSLSGISYSFLLSSLCTLPNNAPPFDLFIFNGTFNGGSAQTMLTINGRTQGVALTPGTYPIWTASQIAQYSQDCSTYYGSRLSYLINSGPAVVQPLTNGSLIVVQATPLQIATTRLPTAVVNQPYAVTLMAIGGQATATGPLAPGAERLIEPVAVSSTATSQPYDTIPTATLVGRPIGLRESLLAQMSTKGANEGHGQTNREARGVGQRFAQPGGEIQAAEQQTVFATSCYGNVTVWSPPCGSPTWQKLGENATITFPSAVPLDGTVFPGPANLMVSIEGFTQTVTLPSTWKFMYGSSAYSYIEFNTLHFPSPNDPLLLITVAGTPPGALGCCPTGNRRISALQVRLFRAAVKLSILW